jgi:hypothetical protein
VTVAEGVEIVVASEETVVEVVEVEIEVVSEETVVEVVEIEVASEETVAEIEVASEEVVAEAEETRQPGSGGKLFLDYQISEAHTNKLIATAHSLSLMRLQ